MTNIEQFTRELMLAHDIDYKTALSRAEQFYDMLENEIPPVLNDDWISVEDRLPNHRDIVLTYDGNEVEFDSFPLLGTITHWQPLPEPPKEK